MVVRSTVVAAALLLVSVSCTGGESISTGSPSALSRTPVPTAASSTELEMREALGGWLYINAIATSPRWMVWGGLQSGDAHQDPEVLMLLDRASGQTRVLARAPEPAGIIGWIRLSDGWVAWADYTDRTAISDWKLRVAPLPAGQPKVIAVAPMDGHISDRPEFDLRDGLLATTARARGERSQLVTLTDLASGSRRVLATAGADELFGWPALSGSTLAFESHRPTVESVVIVSTTDPTNPIRVGSSVAPASEPALASGWLAYKAAYRSSGGQIVIRPVDDGVAPVAFASQAEAPFGGGKGFCWLSGGSPGGAGIYDTETRRVYSVTVSDASVVQVVCDGRSVALLVRRNATALYAIAIASIP